jgi:AcrR family transcriptional regulator
MKQLDRPTTKRMSADERREEILEAAVSEFARRGLHGTSTDTIAQRVGISQPYLFRLFGTKRGLFLAAVERGFDRVQEAFRVAAEAEPESVLEAMGAAYGRLLTNRDELLLQMQSYAACADPEVEELVRRRFGELYRVVEERSGAGEDDVRAFFAHGMLLNVVASMNLVAVRGDDSWLSRCINVEP